MNTIKTFFPLLGQFFQFSKKDRGNPFLLLPASCAPDTTPDIRTHPKTIVSISHQNFNNSIRTISHMSTFTNITKIIKLSLNIQKSNPAQHHNKLAFT